MKPVAFEGHNVIFAKDQPEYQPLPAIRLHDPNGTIVTCWELTEEEIHEVAKTGRLYIKMITFNQPLMPILPMAGLADDIALI